MAEQQVEPGARRALALSPLPRHPDLPENLAFAEHGGVDTRGHREQMTGGDVVVEGIEVIGEGLGRKVGKVAQEVAYVLVRAVEALGDGVDLGAIARGEHDRFTDVGARGQIMQRLGQTLLRDDHPLEQFEWHRPVVQTDDDDRHALQAPSRRPVRRPARPETVPTDRRSRTRTLTDQAVAAVCGSSRRGGGGAIERRCW